MFLLCKYHDKPGYCECIEVCTCTESSVDIFLSLLETTEKNIKTCANKMIGKYFLSTLQDEEETFFPIGIWTTMKNEIGWYQKSKPKAKRGTSTVISLVMILLAFEV